MDEGLKPEINVDRNTVSATVWNLLQNFGPEQTVPASSVALAMQHLHPEYGGTDGWPDLYEKGTPDYRTAGEWVLAVQSFFSTERRARLNGRLLLVGLALAEPLFGQFLAANNFLNRIETEISPPLEQLLRPGRYAQFKAIANQSRDDGNSSSAAAARRKSSIFNANSDTDFKTEIPDFDAPFANAKADREEAITNPDEANNADTSDSPPRAHENVPSQAAATGIADRVVPSQDDHFNVELEAKAFARLIASTSTKPPISIGIFGRWGSGKSFFMGKIQSEITALTQQKPDNFYHDIVPIEFNAWHYMETNVWASLVDVIFKKLDAEINRQQSQATQAHPLFEQLATALTWRMEALQNLVEKTTTAQDARRQVIEAQEKFRRHGPNGFELCKRVCRSLYLREDSATLKQMKAVKSTFGLEIKPFELNAASNEKIAELATLHGELKQLQASGRLTGAVLWRRVVNSKSMPVFVVLAIVLMSLPMLGDVVNRWLELQFNWRFSEIFSALLAGAFAWGGWILSTGKKVVTLLEDLNFKFQQLESVAIAEEQEQRDQAELELKEAQTALKLAEEKANAAFHTLQTESPGARLASFIRERAESNDYSKHLGIIATIRHDFEQLSALIGHRDDQAQQALYAKAREFRQQLSEQLTQLEAQLTPSGATGRGSQTDKGVSALDQNRIDEAIRSFRQTLTADLEAAPTVSRIVLYVDDLDRCPPEKVTDVLQAIHLFLNFPLFVIIVSVDERWMSSSLETRYRKLLTGKTSARPSDYLEKIFQIPYWTRPISRENSITFAQALVDSIKPNTTLKMPSQEAGANNVEAASNAAEVEVGQGEDLNGQGVVEVLNANDRTAVEAQEILTYAPISLTPEEKTMMAQAAAFVGDTPRKTLRYVNVYLLLRSAQMVINDSQPQALGFYQRALALQLALATRADELTQQFFRAVQASRQNPALTLDSFIRNFQQQISEVVKSQPLSQQGQFLQVALAVMNFLVPEWQRSKASEEESFTQTVDAIIASLPETVLDAEQRLLDLAASHAYARRYTFVPLID